MADNTNEAFFKEIGSNYDLLSALYPDKALKLSEIYTSLSIDKSVVSRAWKPLKRAGLINVEPVKAKKGKDANRISLTGIGYRMLSDYREFLERRSETPEVISNEIIDSYVKYLKSPDDEVRSKSFEQIEIISQKRIVQPDCSFITFLSENLAENYYAKHRHRILVILYNIINISREIYLTQYSKIFEEIINKMIDDPRYEGYDEHSKYILLQMYSEIANREEGYLKIHGEYIKSILKDGPYRLNMKDIIKDRYRDKTDALIIELMNLYEKNNGSIRENVSRAIDSFR